MKRKPDNYATGFQKQRYNAAFGELLRRERLAKNLSLSTLAKTLGVTKGYLSRLEHGGAKPSRILIEKIACALEVDPDPIFVLAGYVPPEVEGILYRHPVEAPILLREAFNDYGDAQQTETQLEIKPKLTSVVHASKPSELVKKRLYQLVQGDCLSWANEKPPNYIHAIVTDPPYGLKEYTAKEKAKLRSGRGGVWRIPPTFDGCKRSPLPRFTVLTDADRESFKKFFYEWSVKMIRILVPGGHLFIATNPLLSHLVYLSLSSAGFEKRGEIIRLVQTLRGGDRPKNAHKEFENVTVMPRSCWEPWGLFRKPCEGRVQDNLRKWKTGGLRRLSKNQPFSDVIKSAPTRAAERAIAPHPSLKPQAFMRQIVRSALPLGEGIVLDPFMGAGSTIAAACAVGYQSIGIELDPEFYQIAVRTVPKLATLAINGEYQSQPNSQQTLFDL